MNAITRHNYEEYFILYVDNELGAEERRSVEAFVQLHPDLHDELDLLLQSKLEPDTSVSYAGKEELMFGNNMNGIDLSNYDEWLTLYVDNELQPEQRLAVEQFAKQHQAVAEDLYILQQTRLPVEAIVFPDKESLYRREEKIRRIGWWKVAAAAAIIAGIIGTIVITSNKNNNDNDGVATTDGQKKTLPVDDNRNQREQQPQQQLPNVEGPQQLANATDDDKKERDQVNIDVKNATVNDQSKKKENKKSFDKYVNDDKPEIAYQKKSPDPKDKVIKDDNHEKEVNDDNNNARPTNQYTDVYANAKVDLTNSPTNTTPSSVTTTVYNPYKDQETAPVDTDYTVSDDGQQESKKNKFRGFLRKVTRTFEKTTNIRATDDDDRLLVGGLAIRLK